MGKKSKRSRGGNSGGRQQEPQRQKPPSLRQAQEETKDNLIFEDPFVDEIEQEEIDDVEEDAATTTTTHTPEAVQSWNPFQSTNTTLEMDESAYKMHHALQPEWPCLSFDFVRDSLGESRTRFPHSLYCVAGTQAPATTQNKLMLLKLSDLSKIKVETEDDILGEEYDKEESDDEGDSDDDESEVDLDPSLEHFFLNHEGSVNRVRTMPQESTIVATWSDVGKVNIFNVEELMLKCSGGSANMLKQSASTPTDQPLFTYSGHDTEGFAMDWCTLTKGQLATGDCHGNIHVWQPSGSLSDFSVTPLYESEQSVEDLQWSPTESTVLCAAECGGSVKIYDTRAPHRSMLSKEISNTDINVLSWNKLVANLLATGADDGVLSVWDLRNFQDPLARFTSHKTPITSVEWHPTDESMLAVSDDVGTYIYDLSVEEESGEEEEDIPPQLLFVHCGSEQFKEVHWHPQISSCLMTTALTGFSVFIPSNL